MIENKKGLSAIVTTLLVILLVLVAVGIVWVVVRNVIQSGAEGVELSAKCLQIDLSATAVVCSAGTNHECNVTFERTGINTDVINGVKLVFRNETAAINSGLLDVSGDIEQLVGRTEPTIDTGLVATGSAPDKIEVTVYFKDTSGNEQLCSQTTTSFEF